MIAGTVRRAQKRFRFQAHFSTVSWPHITQTHFKSGIKLNKTSCEANIDTLVIFCGWMSSTDRQLKNYLEYYHRKGIDTLQFSVGTSHVFNPGEGKKHMEYVLQTTLDLQPQNVVFHHFSIGGFLYGQMLRIFEGSSGNKYDEVIPKIKGQIFDSPPDMHSIPEGLAAHFFPSKNHPLHSLVKFFVETYMRLTAKTNGREWRASSETFHTNFLTHVPSLWYYSTADRSSSS